LPVHEMLLRLQEHHVLREIGRSCDYHLRHGGQPCPNDGAVMRNGVRLCLEHGAPDVLLALDDLTQSLDAAVRAARKLAKALEEANGK